jgi:prepilin-type N-terminal cleavage/methylation domain-containing protein
MIAFTPGTTRRRGLTMIELIVAVTVLSLLILMFGRVITQAQRVVSGSQERMRSSAEATAVTQVIRSDLRQATQHGFLAIAQRDDDTPQLMVTTAGVTPSKTHPRVSSGGVSIFGLCDNESGDSDPNYRVLYAQRLVLGDLAEGDVINWDLANVQRRNRARLAAGAGSLVEYLSQTLPPGAVDVGSGGRPAIHIPVQNLGDIEALWQVLVPQCAWMSVMWTDGDVPAGNDGLRWYGVDWVKDPVTEDWGYEPRWRDGAGTDADTWAADDTLVEFEDARGGYRAVWTHHNQGAWPKAVRLRFKLDDELGTYEVICAVGN